MEARIIKNLALFLVLAAALYLAIKFEDLFARKEYAALFEPRLETYCFWLEIVLLLPALALLSDRVRASQNTIFLIATSVALGVMINRLNIALVGMYASSEAFYLPSASELIITALFVTSAVVAFGLAVKFFDIFENEPPQPVRVEVSGRVLTT